jgi:hypothetical protein
MTIHNVLGTNEAARISTAQVRFAPAVWPHHSRRGTVILDHTDSPKPL